MFLFGFFLAILTSEKEFSITEAFTGDWKVTHLTLDSNSQYVSLPDKYKLEVKASDENFVGKLFTYSSGTPKYHIQINKKENLTYSLLYSQKDSETFQTLVSSFHLTTGVDYLIETFGQLNSSVTFSFHFFSKKDVEITLFNRDDDSVSFYRLEKSLPDPQQKLNVLHVLLPILPIFVMMYNNQKAKQKQIQERNLKMRNQKKNSNAKKD